MQTKSEDKEKLPGVTFLVNKRGIVVAIEFNHESQIWTLLEKILSQHNVRTRPLNDVHLWNLEECIATFFREGCKVEKNDYVCRGEA